MGDTGMLVDLTNEITRSMSAPRLDLPDAFGPTTTVKPESELERSRLSALSLYPNEYNP